MFCKQCGSAIANFTTFCPSCGATVNDEPVLLERHPITYSSPEFEAEARSILTWGIVGLVLGLSGLPLGSLVGLILSAMALKKADNHVYDVGRLTGKAKVGKKMAIVGLIVGIVLTIIEVLYIALIIIYLRMNGYTG